MPTFPCGNTLDTVNFLWYRDGKEHILLCVQGLSTNGARTSELSELCLTYSKSHFVQMYGFGRFDSEDIGDL